MRTQLKPGPPDFLPEIARQNEALLPCIRWAKILFLDRALARSYPYRRQRLAAQGCAAHEARRATATPVSAAISQRFSENSQ